MQSFETIYVYCSQGLGRFYMLVTNAENLKSESNHLEMLSTFIVSLLLGGRLSCSDALN